MKNKAVYIINPNFRLQSNHLSVEWINVDNFTLQYELQKYSSTSIYNKGGNLILCRRYGGSLHFIYGEISIWGNRLLQRWLRDKLKDYIIDTANTVLPLRAQELENQHSLYAKRVIVKKLPKNVLGQCCSKSRIISLSPKIILLPQEYLDSIILHEMAHLKFNHHRKSFWDFLTTLLGEDSISQKVRGDLRMSIFYGYSDFLLK